MYESDDEDLNEGEDIIVRVHYDGENKESMTTTQTFQDLLAKLLGRTIAIFAIISSPHNKRGGTISHNNSLSPGFYLITYPKALAKGKIEAITSNLHLEYVVQQRSLCES
ncbi:hypothetical protein DFA_03736 [Cavenderia fasciculata]|uniref:Uncharacterized protein n=1 Tax=Cavenderia fasciculata TaxID=261658 RepID=F4Q098_CACFS|nr:uncharacterized protein DFA_03736 [Cavenderia fasciculata]EGG18249.1 hypothetical protein DFA_03736 [Cavenderia fasciculata]|eukprot:XP_004357072.1 hypothetical protein DFA_03736 [Cavenderia fasciculata]